MKELIYPGLAESLALVSAGSVVNIGSMLSLHGDKVLKNYQDQLKNIICNAPQERCR